MKMLIPAASLAPEGFKPSPNSPKSLSSFRLWVKNQRSRSSEKPLGLPEFSSPGAACNRIGNLSPSRSLSAEDSSSDRRLRNSSGLKGSMDVWGTQGWLNRNAMGSPPNTAWMVGKSQL